MRMRLLVLGALLPAGCREPVERPPRADAAIDTRPKIRVGTFNVRRFFDTSCDSGACQPGDFEEQPTAAQFEARADELAAAIRALDVDVLALQELETQTCLDALLVRLADVFPHGTFGEIGTPGSVDVAMLSRQPFDAVTGHRATRPLTLSDGRVTTFSRELLEIRTRIHDASLAVIAAHFRSKSSDDPLRRLAEAEVSRDVIEDLVAASPATIAILAGDLNDVPGSPPMNALVDDGGLVRLADDLPPGEQGTYVFDGREQALDHLLLAPNRLDARLPMSARVREGGATFGYGGSDHAALTATLVVP